MTAGNERTSKVANRCYHCSEVVATFPEAVIGCLVAEDEHETDDYGQAGYLQ